jgi:hypothetical protein
LLGLLELVSSLRFGNLSSNSDRSKLGLIGALLFEVSPSGRFSAAALEEAAKPGSEVGVFSRTGVPPTRGSSLSVNSLLDFSNKPSSKLQSTSSYKK